MAETNTAPVAAAPETREQDLSKLLHEVMERTKQGESALNPLVGTLTDKVAFWNNTNPAWATAGLNGWDTIPKCTIASSMADGQRVHPALFMQGNWCFPTKGGKLIVIPMVPYMLALARARVPGFRMSILADSAEKCTVRIYNGVEWFEYTYTIEDATRQRLLGKENAWATSAREMLQWKAVRRCFNVACPEVMFGLGSPPEDQEQFDSEPESAKPAPVAPDAVTGPSFTDRLRTNLRARQAGLTGKRALAMTNELLSAMKRDPIEKPEDLTEQLAEIVVLWLDHNYPNLGWPAKAGAHEKPPVPAAPEPEASPTTPEAPAAAPVPVAAAPAPVPDAGGVKSFDERHADAAENVAMEEFEQEAIPAPEPEKADDGDVRTLMLCVETAKKQHPDAIIVKEAPTARGKGLFFTMAPVLKEFGLTSGVKLTDCGEQAIDADLCRRFVQAMRQRGFTDARPEKGRVSNEPK